MLTKRRDLLPVRDLLLLAEFDGRQEGYRIPEYALEDFGHDYPKRLTRLEAGGYLTFAAPQDALKSLTIPKLKEILREHGQKLSGKKDELIARIVDNVPPEKYSSRVPKVYAATATGRFELENRTAYLENKREHYGFLNSEIAELEAQGFNGEEIFNRLFARDILKYGAAGNFTELFIKYLSLNVYLKNHGRHEDALKALLGGVYVRLTGMSDNYINDYVTLEYFFNDPLWRDLDAARTTLNLSDAELIRTFETAAAQVPKVPFSYFSLDTMKEILLDKLHGQENLLDRYASRRNTPPSSERVENIPVLKSGGTGCLLPCLIFLLILAAVFQ